MRGWGGGKGAESPMLSHRAPKCYGSGYQFVLPLDCWSSAFSDLSSVDLLISLCPLVLCLALVLLHGDPTSFLTIVFFALTHLFDLTWLEVYRNSIATDTHLRHHIFLPHLSLHRELGTGERSWSLGLELFGFYHPTQSHEYNGVPQYKV